jgi:hypothetical protein
MTTSAITDEARKDINPDHACLESSMFIDEIEIE